MVVVHASYELELQAMESAIGKNAVFVGKIRDVINLACNYDAKFVLFNEDSYSAGTIPVSSCCVMKFRIK